MHLLQVGRYGKHGPDFQNSYKIIIVKDRFTGLSSHKRLIYKLKCMGIQGKVLNVISDFLMNRLFRVCVEGKFSNFMKVLSGIPRGSVLAPYYLYCLSMMFLIALKVSLKYLQMT